ncbi:hypothetical protein QE152_g18876 [Popillia japonica]|uniref:Uncharacterized protein n=1 Tax=Popillia japonica TaxID=7064 RepID=A0AAW1L3X0_POPJA
MKPTNFVVSSKDIIPSESLRATEKPIPQEEVAARQQFRPIRHMYKGELQAACYRQINLVKLGVQRKIQRRKSAEITSSQEEDENYSMISRNDVLSVFRARAGFMKALRVRRMRF